ncbi:hypothetical protein SAMN05518672_103428 [Chitinophaga sp. CF118]|uniref:hypothetical protein n=1 Tax=Chitinophaga sp. CF118 TaxID=1884367 RepID=UPI0008EB5BF9|nr:hypothetical protein [Chitinophaga sp. CF118]SFD83527.1 hypothetical protein SAMN05518672_103428 [Chitinophaga sp. CF118]
MNYIHHLNSFYLRLDKDERLKPLHISLYMALFQNWNYHHFSQVFIMSRTRLMQTSRIGSRTSFAKVIRELHEFGYIRYFPSLHTGHPAKVTIIPLSVIKTIKSDSDLFSGVPDSIRTSPNSGTTPVPDLSTGSPESGTTPVPDLNTGSPENGTTPVPKVGPFNKQLKQINNLNSVCDSHAHDNHQYKNFNQKEIQPPTIEEVLSWFANQRCDRERALTFFYHYSANGWMIGIHPIRDWKAVALKWIFNTKKTPNHGGAKYLHTSKSEDYSEPL